MPLHPHVSITDPLSFHTKTQSYAFWIFFTTAGYWLCRVIITQTCQRYSGKSPLVAPAKQLAEGEGLDLSVYTTLHTTCLWLPERGFGPFQVWLGLPPAPEMFRPLRPFSTPGADIEPPLPGGGGGGTSDQWSQRLHWGAKHRKGEGGGHPLPQVGVRGSPPGKYWDICIKMVHSECILR